MTVFDAITLEKLFDRLWPICRSLAGPGFRQSLDILSEFVPWTRTPFATGTRVLDWQVPEEWEARSAWICGPDGKKRCDFSQNNLHLLGYSRAIHRRMDLEELRPHLHTLPDLPQAIPYLTSYYQPRWGFCLSHDEYQRLPPGEYEVYIDTEHRAGHLEVAEAVLPGQSSREILLTSYLCHPSMANNELSGPLVLTALYQLIASWPKRRFTYRFVLSAETIGAICFLSQHGERLRRDLQAGMVITCAGDPGPYTYKRSRIGDSLVDRACEWALANSGAPHSIIDFSPALGSDERQYCSPGFNLPVGSLMRTMYAAFSQYHTSLDDKTFICFDTMVQTTAMYQSVLRVIESNKTFCGLVTQGEPQLSRRGLSAYLESLLIHKEQNAALWWLLNLADGHHDILAIAQRSGSTIEDLAIVAERLVEAGLLQEVETCL